MPCVLALMTACVLSVTRSFVKMLERWLRTDAAQVMCDLGLFIEIERPEDARPQLGGSP